MSGASPSEGSSRSRRRGRLISARAIASICCSPPESVPPRWSRRSLRRGNSSKTRCADPRRSVANLVMAAPICRFSITVMRGKMRRPSGDWAMRVRMMSCVGSRVMSSPAIDDLPVARLRIAADGHHQGRLAGAVGADQRDDLALVDVDVDAAQRDDLAVVGLDAADGEERRAAVAAAHSPASSVLQRSADLLDLFVLDAEIGGDDLRVVAHRVGASRRRSSGRSRARRCGRRSP